MKICVGDIIRLGDKFYCPDWNDIFIVTSLRPIGGIEMRSNHGITIIKNNKDLLGMEKRGWYT